MKLKLFPTVEPVVDLREVVYCEDCVFVHRPENSLPDLWRCKDTPIGDTHRTFVARFTVNDYRRCEEVNKDGHCLRFRKREGSAS